MIHGNSNLTSQQNGIYEGKSGGEVSNMSFHVEGRNGLVGSDDSPTDEDGVKYKEGSDVVSGQLGRSSKLKNRLQLERNVENMVPVPFFLKRFTAISLQERNTLKTLLPSKRRTDKKKYLMNFTTKNKFRTLKAKHLIKWAKSSYKIQEAQNLVSLAQKEISKIHNTIGSMHDVGRSLKQDRVENYDVLSAIDIFSTGTFKQVPGIIKERFLPPAELEATQISSALNHINDYMFLRYLKTETIPPCLQDNIKIEDGKFYLSYKKHYEVVLTLLGPSMDLPWHLVSVNILVSGDKTDLTSTLETTLAPHQYHLLFKTAQNMLLPLHLREDYQAPESEVNGVSLPDSKVDCKSRHIQLLHDYLFSFCQSLQLEVMFSQAYILASHRWKDQLLVEMQTNRTGLKLKYWSKFLPLSFTTKSGIHDRDHSHYLLISKLEGSSEKLQVLWGGFTIESLQSKLKKEDGCLFQPSEKELLLDPTCLNIETMLMKLIRLHSKIILILLRNHLICKEITKKTFGISDTLEASDITFVETDTLSMFVQLSHCQKLRVSIDFRSGRCKIYMHTEHGNEVRLLELEKETNSRPEAIKTIILEWRIKRVLESIRISAVLSGLDSTFKLPLSSSDMNKFGTNIQRLLYLSLPKCTDNYLVVGVMDQTLKFWHIAVQRKFNLFSITQMTFLNQDLIQKVQEQSLELMESIELNFQESSLLDRLLKLCQGYYISSTIEEQFVRFHVRDYFKVPSLSCNNSCNSLTVPESFQKFIQTTSFFSESSEAFPQDDLICQLFSVPVESLNLIISASTPFIKGPVQVFVSQPQTQWIGFTFHVRQTQLPNFDTLKLPNHWVLDEVNENITSLTMLYQDFSTCVCEFYQEWLALVLSTKLHLEILNQIEIPVLNYDMQTLTVRYHEHYSLTIGWMANPDALVDSALSINIQLHSNQPQGLWNPHLRILTFLVSLFTKTFNLTKVLELCKLTLPVLKALDEYERRSIRPVNIIPISATNFKMVYSSNCCIEIVLVSSNQILIRDGFVNLNSRTIPVFYTTTNNQNSFHLKPATSNWFRLYTTNLPFIIKRFSDQSLSNRQFFQSKEGVFCDSELTISALLGLDWIYVVLCVFQRANSIISKEQKSYFNCTTEADFVISYTAASGNWVLKTNHNLSNLVFEPTVPPNSEDRTLFDDVSLLSKFFMEKINQISPYSSVAFHAAYSLTQGPSFLLHDLAESLRLSIDPASKGLTEANLCIEWHLMIPSGHHFSNAGLPRVGAPVSVFIPKDNLVKTLFSIRRADVVLVLPLQLNIETRSLSYCHKFYRDPNGIAPIVQRQALVNLITSSDRELPVDSKLFGILDHICRLPIHDFRYAASS